MRIDVRKMFKNGFAYVSVVAAVFTAAFMVACSDSKDVAGGSTEDAGIIADLNVAGVTQKGPFVKGSAVTVQGVDCKTFKFTDDVFEGSVKSDKGDFEIKGINLSSACAVFEVSGYYLNEITGKKSSEKLTLHALANLKDRKRVNINVLTDLEYGRVMNLVTVEKMSFEEAKKQAEKEVLESFGIEGDFDNSEDLNLFEKGDGNAALLAVSVTVLASTSEKKLAERLEEYSDAISKNGSLDEDAKKEIEKWAASATASGKLDTIRKNIESWGYAEELPAFEKHISSRHSGQDPESSSSRDGGSSSAMTKSSSSATKTTSSSSTPIEDLSSSSSRVSSSSSRHSGLDPESSSSKDGGSSSAMTKSSSSSTKTTSSSSTPIEDLSSSSSRHSGQDPESSSSLFRVSSSSSKNVIQSSSEESSDITSSSSSLFRVQPCKTDSSDTCEYGTLTDSRDGQTYKTVKIGDQWWMAENLNYDPGQGVFGDSTYDWSWCYGKRDNKDSSTCDMLGRLYTWAAAIDSIKLAKDSIHPLDCGYEKKCDLVGSVQGVCPNGWHLPSDAEWSVLFSTVGELSIAGKALKSQSGWNRNGNGVDAFGFAALPAGYRNFAGRYYYYGYNAFFWSSTEYYSGDYRVSIMYLSEADDASLDDYSKGLGFSVRCLKN